MHIQCIGRFVYFSCDGRKHGTWCACMWPFVLSADPPFLLEDLPMGSLRFGIGSSHTLCVRCRGSHGCSLVYTWMKSGREISTSADSIPGRLELKAVTSHDAGEYMCHVRYQEYPDMKTSSRICTVRITGGNDTAESDVSTIATDESFSDQLSGKITGSM